MKYISIISSLPFPFVIVCANTKNVIYKNSETFFDEPKSQLDLNFLTNIDKNGWTTCPQGFATFSKRISIKNNIFLILYGLKVKPFWKQHGKSNYFTVVTDQKKIENYIGGLLEKYSTLLEEIELEQNEKIRSFAVENIHEIRSINSSLYNIGYELQEILQYEKHQLALAKNIVALSELISTRIDLTDITIYENEEDILEKSPPSPVFKIFDKIIRCYIAYAAKRKITFKLEGSSRTQSLGLKHFELIPMILIDNAVKYSPNGKEVKIIFSEDDIFINVEIISLGPKINQDEKSKIFNKLYRGKDAIQSGKKGSGIGLYFVSKLMDSINSTIHVFQEEEKINLDRKTFYKTTFELAFKKTK